MYPTISDLLKDLFGITIPLPIQTFGFFVALSFLAAAYTLSLELKRKEKLGLISTMTRNVWKGKRASASELLFSGIIGFIIGYKILYFILNYRELVADPQGSLLSLKGSLLGGMLLGAFSVWLKYRDAEKTKKDQPELVTEIIHPSDLVSNFTMVAAIAGILGAKLFHNLEYLDNFFKDPVGELLSFSGLTMYGGLIVGALAVILYGRKQGVAPLHLSDAAAPGLMLAYGTGRIGCQLSGDGDWGIVNSAPKPGFMSFLPDWMWSYNYPNNVIHDCNPFPPNTQEWLQCNCSWSETPYLVQNVFPTPFYECVMCILLFFVLWSLRKKLIAPGLMFSVYLVLNGAERFLIEQIRVNSKYHAAGIAFTQAQLISVLLVLLGVTGIWYFRKVHRKAIGNSHE